MALHGPKGRTVCELKDGSSSFIHQRSSLSGQDPMQWQEMNRGLAEASPVANASGSGENQTGSKNEESIGQGLNRPSIINWVSVFRILESMSWDNKPDSAEHRRRRRPARSS